MLIASVKYIGFFGSAVISCTLDVNDAVRFADAKIFKIYNIYAAGSCSTRTRFGIEFFQCAIGAIYISNITLFTIILND